jgi:hypothetical protein
MQFIEEVRIRISGHIKIFEYESLDDVGTDKGKVLLDKRNAVHNENMSIGIARGMGNRDNGSVFSMHFGVGGATVDPLGNILFATPNTTGAADLNTPVYFEVVDDNQGAPAGNQMAVRHINGTLFSDLEVRCVVDKDEPFGQPAFDNVGTNLNTSLFVFDEIGLKTEDGLLLTHVVFSPVEKSANRIIEVVYTLRFRICE